MKTRPCFWRSLFSCYLPEWSSCRVWGWWCEVLCVDLKRERLILWANPPLFSPWVVLVCSHPPNWETILTKIRMFPFKLRDWKKLTSLRKKGQQLLRPLRHPDDCQSEAKSASAAAAAGDLLHDLIQCSLRFANELLQQRQICCRTGGVSFFSS
jgi:hypothetical protein